MNPPQLHRLEPEHAFAALREGAVLLDVRPAAQRATEGVIPQALHVEPGLLQWLFDPASDDHLPLAAYDLRLIVISSQGRTSSLAAATLQQLGLHLATDVVGGFHAWRSAGLPVVAGPELFGLALVPPPAAHLEAVRGLDVRREERRVFAEGQEVDLTRLEFDLLAHLVDHPHRVHTRDALLSRLWAGRGTESGRTVDVHVARLRRKLGRSLSPGLQTVRGVGYRWVPPVAGAA